MQVVWRFLVNQGANKEHNLEKIKSWKGSQLEEEDQGAIQYANAFGIAQDQRYNSILDLCRLMVDLIC